VAEINVPEEFLFDISKSIEDLSLSQNKVVNSIDNLNAMIDGLSDTSEDLSKAINTFSPSEGANKELLSGIADLTSAIRRQTESGEESSKNIFDILRPTPETGAPRASNLSGILESIPRFEEGGEMQKSGAAIVGEKGPELLLLPQGSQISPLESSFFESFDAFLKGIDSSEYVENLLGGKKFFIHNPDDGSGPVLYPNTTESVNSSPIILKEKIESERAIQKGIFNNPTESSADRTFAKSALQILENLERIPGQAQYNSLETYFPSVLEKLPTQPVDILTGLTETLKTGSPESINQIDSLTATETPSISPILSPNETTQASMQEETSFIEQSSPAISSPVNKPPSSAPEIAAMGVKSEANSISELVNNTQTLARQESPLVPPPPPPPASTTIIQQEPPAFSAPATTEAKAPAQSMPSFDNSEKLLKEMNENLSRVASLMAQMNGSLSKVTISSESYPIRPSNKNF
jgi:hypothetical protein